MRILEQKYMNYHAVKPNFRGRFVKQKVMPQETYDALKIKHLREQEKSGGKKSKFNIQRDMVVTYAYLFLDMKLDMIMELTGIGKRAVYNIIAANKEEIMEKYKPKEK